MPISAKESASTQAIPTNPALSSSRLRRTVGEQRELTTSEQCILDDVLDRCERRFDESAFFRRLADRTVTTDALAYVFGQYGHFRVQLHRWFAVCIILAKDASEPAQREAVMALADHIFTDLRDDHDRLFAECLEHFGFPAGTLYAGPPSPATIAYIQSFLDDASAPTATWVEAVAGLAGRELSVALRNLRLSKSYFAARNERTPTWIALHAELEVDHFLDALRPLLTEHDLAATPPHPALLAVERAFGRHAEYLDALLGEHEAARREASRV